MDNTNTSCQHLNEITDYVEGAIVCTDCGLVLSSVFLNNYCNTEIEIKIKNNQCDYILEILSRLQMPDFFKNIIYKNLLCIDLKYRKNENAIAYVIYKTLNDENCGITIKDISAVTGYTEAQIYNFQSSNECVILNPLNQVEKFCRLLQLPKNSYSVIKENIPTISTGHNPTTVLGAAIYIYCKSINFNVSIVKIAQTLNISFISIQRYLKLLKNEPKLP